MQAKLTQPNALHKISSKFSAFVSKIENSRLLAKVPKKIVRPALAVIVLLVLGSAVYFPAAASATPAGPGAGDATFTQETRLIAGTFKLEDTDYAVTSEQAAELLPLWQVYSELSASDTAAQAEVDALFAQIQDTMIPEQRQAIQTMQLTQEDVFAVMQERGIEMGPGEGGGQGLTPDQIATAQASRGAGSANPNRVPPAWIEALIEFLQEKAGA